MQARLAAGETIRLHASVKAGQHASPYDIVTATIPGADPRLKDEEIAFTCHLDHPEARRQRQRQRLRDDPGGRRARCRS